VGDQGGLADLARFIVGPAEIAALLHVDSNTINAWKARDVDFPQPIRRLRHIVLWDEREVLEWARRTGRYPPRTSGGAEASLEQQDR
jgi:predicted DNA-binding transcriptional regulator AlpA